MNTHTNRAPIVHKAGHLPSDEVREVDNQVQLLQAHKARA